MGSEKSGASDPFSGAAPCEETSDVVGVGVAEGKGVTVGRAVGEGEGRGVAVGRAVGEGEGRDVSVGWAVGEDEGRGVPVN